MALEHNDLGADGGDPDLVVGLMAPQCYGYLFTNLLEERFSEVRLQRILGSSHSPGPTPMSMPDSDLLHWGIILTFS